MDSPTQKATDTIDITDLSISEYHAALCSGKTTIEAVVSAYLDRITQHDATIKSVITINPHAKAEAKKMDEQIIQLRLRQRQCYPKTEERISSHQSQAILSPLVLFGVPILLKDNYTTASLPTSAGSKSLASLISTKDCTVVNNLLHAGAIILGKTNLHEFALHGTTTSSLGGQTLNPYDLTRTPGGSSGGTGAALALNLGMVGCGTDTVNSLRSPASSCSIVGFRPSTGSISCEGIVPVSKTQDVAGPMARCVSDVRTLYNAMRNPDTHTERSEERHLMKKEVRIGVLEEYFYLEKPKPNDSSAHDEGTLESEISVENSIVQDIVRKALSSISSSSLDVRGFGDIKITLVSIPNSSTNAIASNCDWSISRLQSADTQAFEFKESLDEFLSSQDISSPHTSLESIAASGEYDNNAVTEVFTLPLSDANKYNPRSEEYQTRLFLISELKNSVHQVFQHYELDALAYPHQRHFPIRVGSTVQPGRNGLLAALTRRPAICIPAGFSPATAEATQGIPVGLELMGHFGKDGKLLDLAEFVEGVLRARKVPSLG